MAIKLSSEHFISAAIEAAKSNDFGGETYKEGLDAFINSLNNDLNLSEMIANYFQTLITQKLVNRAEVAKFIKKHPEILQEKIEQPIFILGLPRSGTSIMHILLALDPTSRYLRNFESALAICPPPELLSSYVDPRIQTYHTEFENIFYLMPLLRGINGINFMANGPAECQNLMMHEFIHLGMSVGCSLFSYGDWIANCNMKNAYHYHKLLLKMLQWKLPNEKWVLKAIMHLFGLDSLLEIYPDARIVFTHRNPLDAMASGISLTYHWTRYSTQQADASAIAEWYPKIFAKGLKRALNVRQNFDQKQFYDVYHKDILDNPVKATQDIYKHFGMEFTKTHQKRIQVWIRDNPRSKFGNHKYSVKQFKLNPEIEQKRFQFYYDKYDIQEDALYNDSSSI